MLNYNHERHALSHLNFLSAQFKCVRGEEPIKLTGPIFSSFARGTLVECATTSPWREGGASIQTLGWNPTGGESQTTPIFTSSDPPQSIVLCGQWHGLVTGTSNPGLHADWPLVAVAPPWECVTYA